LSDLREKTQTVTSKGVLKIRPRRKVHDQYGIAAMGLLIFVALAGTGSATGLSEEQALQNVIHLMTSAGTTWNLVDHYAGFDYFFCTEFRRAGTRVEVADCEYDLRAKQGLNQSTGYPKTRTWLPVRFDGRFFSYEYTWLKYPTLPDAPQLIRGETEIYGRRLIKVSGEIILGDPPKIKFQGRAYKGNFLEKQGYVLYELK